MTRVKNDSGRPQVSGAFDGPAASPGVAFAVPVLRAEQPVALLLGTLDASDIERFLDEPRTPRGRTLTLRDSRGRLISGQDMAPARAQGGPSEPVRHVHAFERAPWKIVVDVPPPLVRAVRVRELPARTGGETQDPTRP